MLHGWLCVASLRGYVRPVGVSTLGLGRLDRGSSNFASDPQAQAHAGKRNRKIHDRTGREGPGQRLVQGVDLTIIALLGQNHDPRENSCRLGSPEPSEDAS